MNKDKVYLPTLLETGVIPIAVFLTFVLLNARTFFTHFFTQDEVIIADGYTSLFFYYLNNDTLNNFGVFIFWTILGLVSYAIVLVLTLVFTAYKSELPMRHYSVFAVQSNAADIRRTRFLRFMIRTGGAIGFLALLIIGLTQLLPLIDRYFTEAIISFNITYLIGTVLSGSIFVFSEIFMLRLFVLRTRVFQEG